MCERRPRDCGIVQTSRGSVQIASRYRPDYSGAGIKAFEVSKRLIDLTRDRVYFLTYTFERTLPRKEFSEGVEVQRIVLLRSRILRGVCAAFETFVWLFRRGADYQTIFVHGFLLPSVIAAVAVKILLGKQVFVKLVALGCDDLQTLLYRVRLNRLNFWVLGKIDGIYAQSPALLNADAFAEKSRVSTYGVDTAIFRPAERGEKSMLRKRLSLASDKFLILYAGAVVPRKGLRVLIDAISKLTLKDRVQVVIIGPTTEGQSGGEIRKDYVDLCWKRIHASQIDATTLEFTPHLEKYYRAADLFVLPTFAEGLPTVLLEAMSSGIPVAVSRLPGITDFVIEHMRSGLLFEPGSVDELARIIALCLQGPPWAAAMGRVARETVELRFNLETTVTTEYRIIQ